jgi:hypothetical protein
VDCVLSMGGWLVRGGGSCRALGGGLRSVAALVDVRLMASPAPFFLADSGCGGLSVGWVSCLT